MAAAGGYPSAGAQFMEAWAALADRQLVTRALSGEPDAYGELVRRHQAAVYGAIYRLVGDRQEALDLAQDVFVRAYGALGSFDAERSFAAWVGRIAVNTALNWLRRRRLPTVPLGGERGPDDREPGRAGALPPADERLEPERAYLAGERHERLRRAILALPAPYRAVIELRHFQELAYDEISQALGLPLSDVKSHLFRARRLLREGLEGERDDI